MERTKKVTDDERILWRKDGGGSFRLPNGKIIKPGQTFKATVSEIPEAFRDVVIALDEIPPVEEEEIEVEDVEYELSSRGGGWYDVLDPNGKVMNEKALKKEDAEQLIEDLK